MKLKKLTAIITMLGLSALALSACSGTTQAAAPAEAAAVESTVESTAATEMEPAEEAAQPTDESAVAEALKEEVAAEQTAESMYVLHQERVASPEWVTKLPAAQDENVKQLFVVAGLGMDKTTASISMHERSEDGKWEQILFNKAFGIAADPGCAIPYIQVTDDTYWSGDIREGYHYNEMVNLSDYPDLDMENSEHIVDYIYQYQYCLNISFNEDGTAGRGSAIFLHSFGPTKPYTGGCVALPEYMMKMVMTNVDPDCVVVIDTLENMGGEL